MDGRLPLPPPSLQAREALEQRPSWGPRLLLGSRPPSQVPTSRPVPGAGPPLIASSCTAHPLPTCEAAPATPGRTWLSRLSGFQGTEPVRKKPLGCLFIQPAVCEQWQEAAKAVWGPRDLPWRGAYSALPSPSEARSEGLQGIGPHEAHAPELRTPHPTLTGLPGPLARLIRSREATPLTVHAWAAHHVGLDKARTCGFMTLHQQSLPWEAEKWAGHGRAPGLSSLSHSHAAGFIKHYNP